MARYGSLPFREQIEFFRDKLSLPTETWTDIVEGMHARAFVVAGAMREDLLSDLREAVDRAIGEERITYRQFKQEFSRIVERYGWRHKGGRSWRARTIHSTNLRTSYHAGRYKQMKEIAARRPYWRYRHNIASVEPREQHLGWDGLILRHDDPWWDTHYPPNGWGCKCYVETLSERDLARMGRDGPDSAPPLNVREERIGVRGPNPRTVRVPEGIDPGWGYNVGQAAFGRRLSDEAFARWQGQPQQWDVLEYPAGGPASWETLRLPRDLPAAATHIVPGPRLTQAGEVVEYLEREVLNAKERLYQVPGAGRVLVSAESLGLHIVPVRAEYLPFLPDLLENPQEVWQVFLRHRRTGKVALRTRIIKAYREQARELLFVADVNRGMLTSHTFVPVTAGKRKLNSGRSGQLLWPHR